MAHLDVEVNFDDITAAIQKRIDAALEVATDVPQLLVDRASLENEDVDGNQFPAKQPRPKRNPKNFPDIACLETGTMFDHDRWTVEKVSSTETDVRFSPPDYFQYLIDKDADKGGRRWITEDKINPNVEAEVEKRMTEAFEESD